MQQHGEPRKHSVEWKKTGKNECRCCSNSGWRLPFGGSVITGRDSRAAPRVPDLGVGSVGVFCLWTFHFVHIAYLSKSERKLTRHSRSSLGPSSAAWPSRGPPSQLSAVSLLHHSCSGVSAPALNTCPSLFLHGFPEGIVSVLPAYVSENGPAWPSGRHWYFHSSCESNVLCPITFSPGKSICKYLQL